MVDVYCEKPDGEITPMDSDDMVAALDETRDTVNAQRQAAGGDVMGMSNDQLLQHLQFSQALENITELQKDLAGPNRDNTLLGIRDAAIQLQEAVTQKSVPREADLGNMAVPTCGALATSLGNEILKR